MLHQRYSFKRLGAGTSPVGPVVKKLSASAEDPGSIPGQGSSHPPWGD